MTKVTGVGPMGQSGVLPSSSVERSYRKEFLGMSVLQSLPRKEFLGMSAYQPLPWFLTRRAVFAGIGVVLPLALIVVTSSFVHAHPEQSPGAAASGFLVFVLVMIGAIGVATTED